MEPSTPSGDQTPAQPGAPSGASPSGEQPTIPSYPPVYPPAQPGQPTDPSQPLYGQPGAYPPPGQSGPYSQPLYGQPGQPGPYSQPLYGQPGPYSQPLQAPPAQPKRSLRWLWITLAIVLVVGLLLGGGAFFAFTNYTAPATAAGKYCGYLKTQNYDSAYGMLSAKLKGQYTSDQFRQASTELDNAEGKVTACGAGSGSNAYKYTLFGNSATVVATTTREKQGLLQGEIGLVNNDGWKVDSLATSLIGINLGALDTLGKFCQAYQTQNYSGAYALLAASLKTATTQEQFTSFQTLQDQVDGKVTACALEQITNGTDTDANVQVSLTRSTLGKRVGAVSLTAAGDSWAVSNVADDLQGTDLTGFVVGSTFCTDIVTGKFTEASAMVTANIATQLTKYGGLAGFFKLPTGYTYAGCTPDPTGYKAQSGEASFVSILKTQVGATPGPSLKLALTLTSGATAGSWQVAGIRVDLA